ncbi:MAG: GntR family transcriptional regulator [Atribacterota bacterium]
MEEKISVTRKFPLYQQVYETLRTAILTGKWPPGALIPPEPQLMEELGVSRTTLRQGIDLLCREGLLKKKQGKGTFVSVPSLEENIHRIVSFTEDMLQRGLTPQTRVIFSGLVEAPLEIAEKLGIPPGEELARLDRLRLANGEPLSVEEAHLVHKFCPGVLERHNYALVPLRKVLQDDYHIQLVRAKETIRAISAPKNMMRLLEVERNVPLLFIERVSIDQHGRKVEYLRKFYRGDRYVLYNELQG